VLAVVVVVVFWAKFVFIFFHSFKHIGLQVSGVSPACQMAFKELVLGLDIIDGNLVSILKSTDFAIKDLNLIIFVIYLYAKLSGKLIFLCSIF